MGEIASPSSHRCALDAALKTWLAIAEANGAAVDDIVARVVAADTARGNRAVADQWLAGPEAQVKEMLAGAFQFGNRDASGS